MRVWEQGKAGFRGGHCASVLEAAVAAMAAIDVDSKG